MNNRLASNAEYIYIDRVIKVYIVTQRKLTEPCTLVLLFTGIAKPFDTFDHSTDYGIYAFDFGTLQYIDEFIKIGVSKTKERGSNSASVKWV